MLLWVEPIRKSHPSLSGCWNAPPAMRAIVPYLSFVVIRQGTVNLVRKKNVTCTKDYKSRFSKINQSSGFLWDYVEFFGIEGEVEITKSKDLPKAFFGGARISSVSWRTCYNFVSRPK